MTNMYDTQKNLAQRGSTVEDVEKKCTSILLFSPEY